MSSTSSDQQLKRPNHRINDGHHNKFLRDHAEWNFSMRYKSTTDTGILTAVLESLLTNLHATGRCRWQTAVDLMKAAGRRRRRHQIFSSRHHRPTAASVTVALYPFSPHLLSVLSSSKRTALALKIVALFSVTVTLASFSTRGIVMSCEIRATFEPNRRRFFVLEFKTRSSAIAVIADRTACSSTIGQKQLLRAIYFNAVHCDRSISTCE